MIKKILLTMFTSIFIFFNFSFVSSYQVDLPTWMSDVKSEATIDQANEKDFHINFSSFINKYLWFILGPISFWVVIYAWILLMKSNWEEAEMKKWNKILTWWIVWIFVSLWAYTIINLLINIL